MRVVFLFYHNEVLIFLRQMLNPEASTFGVFLTTIKQNNFHIRRQILKILFLHAVNVKYSCLIHVS